MTPKQSTIEALVEAIDADDDDILHARYVLFKHAIDRYHDQLYLMLGGEAAKPKQILKNSKGRNATIALSRDVYALFLYVSGVDACFPKDVLSIKCKLVEIENTIPVFFTPKVVTVKGNDDGPTNPESTVHNHKATEQEECKTLGWLRANVDLTLPALGRHWTAASTRTQWQHTNHHTLPSACTPAQSHYTACKQYTPRRQHNRHLELTLWHPNQKKHK